MAPEAKSQTATCRLKDLVLYFIRLGALGFGGPIAMVSYMQQVMDILRLAPAILEQIRSLSDIAGRSPIT